MIDFDRIKEANRIEEVIQELGKFQLDRQHGRYVRAVEHDSFTIDVQRQYYYWNSRGRGGSVFDYLVQEHGLDDLTAWRWLADRAGIELRLDERQAQQLAHRRQREDVMTVMAQHFQSELARSATAAKYVASRGWTMELAQQEGLGWWAGDLDAADRLRKAIVTAGHDVDHPAVVAILGYRGDIAAWAKKWGISAAAQWIENGRVPGIWRGAWLIYCAMNGPRCVYFAGRNSNPDEKRWRHWKPAVELVGEQLPYWNSLAGLSDSIVVVEGQADAVSCAAWGLPAVALTGLADSFDATKRLKKYAVVSIGMDNDKAGLDSLTGNRPIARLIQSLGPMTRVFMWPKETKDANGWLQAGATAQQATALVTDGLPYIVWLAKGHGPIADVYTRRQMVMEMAAHLRPDQLARVRDALLGRDALNMSVGAFNMGVASITKKKRHHEPAQHNDSADDLMMQAKLLTEPADHEGHAQCVLALYPDHFAYVPEWGWMAWTGHKWGRQGAQSIVERAITDTLRKRASIAAAKGNERLVDASGASHPNVTGTRLQLQSATTLATSDFDNDPDLLNVANGVLDLRTGELVSHEPGLRFTYCLGVDYDPDADSDVHWLAWLYQTVGDEQVAQWLQKVAGYCLTGHTREEVFFYLYGPSRSGKGTWLETMLALLGEPLGMGVNMETFTADRGQDTNNFDLAPLAASRLVVASESESHRRLNSTKMKQWTGGDPVWASFKGQTHFSYRPKFKIFMASNFRLNMHSDDRAAWGRARVIPFPNSYLGQEDRTLKERFKQPEYQMGILKWAVEGARRWYEEGLGIVPAVRNETESHRSEQDLVQIWLNEEAVVANPDDHEAFTPLDLLVKAYQAWCKANGVRAKGLPALRQDLEEKGYQKAKRRHAMYKSPRAGFNGIVLEGHESTKEMSL